jgi:hypothetical protein
MICAATRKLITMPIEKIQPNDHPDNHDIKAATIEINIVGIAKMAAVTLTMSAQYIILCKTSFIL